MISSRRCSFPPCLSCFYMVSFGLPTHVRILLRSCPKFWQCISGWILGTGIRHCTTWGLLPGTWPARQIKQVKVNTILTSSYICMWHPNRLHEHGSYASRNNPWRENHVVVSGCRRQPLKLQNRICQYLGKLLEVDSRTELLPIGMIRHPATEKNTQELKLWSLESWNVDHPQW